MNLTYYEHLEYDKILNLVKISNGVVILYL